jgi:predicted nucleotidyltransferase
MPESATPQLPIDAIRDLCRRWKVRELALFGSALGERFRPDSDIDLLVTFDAGAEWSLFDHVRMQQELSALLGREVDLVSRRGVEASPNPVRRKAILDSASTLYATG